KGRLFAPTKLKLCNSGGLHRWKCSLRKAVNAFTDVMMLFIYSCCYNTVHTFRIVTVNFSFYTTAISNSVFVLIFSHFRQLHTSTNLLLLSLAVADFLVGFLQMPSDILLFQGCWIFGDFICVVNYFLGYLIVIGSMVLISIDRYIAICDPMFYSTKVTLRRVQYCVYLCWVFSVVHSSWILRDFLKQPNRYNSCYGECVLRPDTFKPHRANTCWCTNQKSLTQ
uniref:G-protein coupled receptors family 1 profile domain-containing protein n=1 Tax=Seriola dumerili TaxID=41447 RepID=A0A3B4UTE0_SERDU